MDGFAAEGFGRVADAFARVLEYDEGSGCEVALVRDGVPVVDLWGGTDVVRDRPYPQTALTRVASCSKGITATALGILVDRGQLDPHAPVVQYWPEYGQNGKESTTVAMVASHQAGVPFPEIGSHLQGLDYFTSPELVRVLARQAPLWEPGTAVAYHPATAGAILDEIAFRASGRRLAEIVRSEMAEPLSLSTWLGLPPERLPDVVHGRWVGEFPVMTGGVGKYAEQRLLAGAEVQPLDPDPDDAEQVAAYYAASVPAVGAVTDARSLARMYAATIGSVDGTRLYSEGTLRELTASLTKGKELLIESGTAGPDLEFGFGYQLPTSSMPAFGSHSFGHTGAGGRLGLADTDLGIGFGFVCSAMRVVGPEGDPRWELLTTAIREAISGV
ncbi:MAG TPA: serine hydrolase domain-containing protein [Microbacterium sp.]|uniref:serine hydrolase domain-containing protein n=1 Tax=Microbacterium sp. TaxID=51671 RepID=UPI002C0FF77B|nr:serine hydrolase domain-containing protein [Microbacterium sp.]HWI31991.1 serine hydrolase domain-containing protein [Microbacterium sp.]